MDKLGSRRLVRVAEGEVRRAMQQMRIPGNPRPYYISHLIRDQETWQIQARYGSRITDLRERKRNAFVDVRVGSYRRDHVRDGGLEDNDKEAESYVYVELPFGEESDGLRHGLWRLTEARYREAVEALFHKRSHELTYRDPNRHLRAFEKREPVTDLGWQPLPEVDRDHWSEFVERTSRLLRRYTEIFDSHVEFRADHECKVFVNSEGSKRVQTHTVWSLECYVWLLSERGDGVPWTHRVAVRDPRELPSRSEFERQIRSAVRIVKRLAKAPTVRSYCGPALLEPVPAGLLLHEAVGHRLEGNRLLSAGEGQTFKEAIGERILPPFLSVRDNPGLSDFGGRSLVGHYRFDDEGVEAQDVLLVDRGVLRGYLSGRAGIARSHSSNGHARSNYHQRPISRMGVLLAEAEPGLTPGELKRILLHEVRRKKAPYGVRIIEASSGETTTDAYNFQAFLGEVNLAAKVYPDGREEWIRGVNFVGTPLNAIRGILGAGKRLEVDNAYCGAESGYLPVSTISPALVVSELELQAKPDTPYTPYSLPLPWVGAKA